MKEKNRKNLFRTAVTDTLPVMMGYLSMGAAYGVLLVTQVRNANFLWAFGISTSTISGSMQFAAVEMLANAAKYSLPLVALLALLINIRYAVYGIGFVRLFQEYPWYVRWYLTLGLTDETYAIETRDRRHGQEKMHYFLLVTALDHSYWVVGTVLGAAAGKLLTFDTTGIDFAMTALFLVIAVDLCRDKSNRFPTAAGGISTLLVLSVFLILLPNHTNKMLLPAMILMIVLLYLFRKQNGYQEQEKGKLP